MVNRQFRGEKKFSGNFFRVSRIFFSAFLRENDNLVKIDFTFFHR